MFDPDETSRLALRETSGRAVGAAVDSVSARLRDPDVWLSPQTAPDLNTSTEPGWSLDVPSWLAPAVRRGMRRSSRLGVLDDPGNRIWVTITSAAGRARSRAWTRAASLQRRWKGYRAAYERYEALARVTA